MPDSSTAVFFRTDIFLSFPTSSSISGKNSYTLQIIAFYFRHLYEFYHKLLPLHNQCRHCRGSNPVKKFFLSADLYISAGMADFAFLTDSRFRLVCLTMTLGTDNYLR